MFKCITTKASIPFFYIIFLTHFGLSYRLLMNRKSSSHKEHVKLLNDPGSSINCQTWLLKKPTLINFRLAPFGFLVV